jgi:hypothetical protein
MLRTSNRRPPLRTQRVMSFLATLPAAFSDKKYSMHGIIQL